MDMVPNAGSNVKRRTRSQSANGSSSIDVTAPPEQKKVKTSKMASNSSRKVDAEGKPETSSKTRHKKDSTPSSSVSSDDDSDKRSSSTSSSATAIFTIPVSCTDSTDEAQSQEALSTKRTAKYPAWVPITTDEVISSLKLENVITMFNNFMAGYQEMTKARYVEMRQVLQAGETEFKKLLTAALLEEFKSVLIPEYKDGCLLTLLCNSWATKGCCDILDASVTKANILASPLFTGFCIYVNIHPFSLDYDDGKTIGLDALTGDSQFSNHLIGAYHSMVIAPLMTYVNVASTSSRTHSDEFEQKHWKHSSKFLCLDKGVPHMEHLYNAKLAHSNWGRLKEIDMLASAREIFISALSSITQNADGHSKFTEATVLKLLKGVVEENPSCIRDPAYQTYVTKLGELYERITRIRIAIGSKGGTASGKISTSAAEKHKKGIPLLDNEKRRRDGNVKAGTASGKISTSAAEKHKKGIPLLDNEKKVRDGNEKGGKASSITKQSHFWCIKGETEDKVLTDASVGDVCKYVQTNFKKCCGMSTLQRRLKIFVKENEAKKWSTIDLKTSKKAESLPLSVQYKDNPAYKGCFMSQNTKVKAKSKSEKIDASEDEEDFDDDMLEESDGED